MANTNKKGLNTNSTVYILVYAVVLVVIVAFLLAFVYQALKPLQDANVSLDKKKQILYALNIRNLDSDKDYDTMYKKVIVADKIISANGTEECKGEQGGEKAGFTLNSSDFKQGKLAVFVCRIDGQTKYVIPVYGMGLWGSINGYVALNSDKKTVYGVYFNHEGETAGLGAEIKDNASWQKKFQNKKVLTDDGKDIALSVKKNVTNVASDVDAVTGATITSTGVSNMLHDCLRQYLVFLNDVKDNQ